MAVSGGSLESLFRPRSVAVVGATEKEGFGGATTENLLTWSKAGRLKGRRFYLVNPRRKDVFGVTCYASLGELPEVPELCIVCTPREIAVEVLREAGMLGTRAAVVYASGFSELGERGAALDGLLVETCRRYSILLCGPNCAGFINCVDGVPAFGIPVDALEPGCVGIVAQSGQIVYNLVGHGALGITYAVSSGNEAVVDTSAYLDFLVQDPLTRVIGLYVEGIRSPGRFVEALGKGLEAGKTIVVVKAGRSEASARIARAHTGSMVGSDAAFSAVCRSRGAIRVDDLDEMVDHIKVAVQVASSGEGVDASSLAAVNLSGGEAALVADMAAVHGLVLPQLAQKTLDRLASLLPEFATVGNPLDVTAALSYDEARFSETLQTLVEDPGIKFLVVGHNIPPRVPEGDRPFQDRVARVLSEVKRRACTPIFVVSALSGHCDQEYAEKLRQGGICLLQGTKKAMKALSGVCRHLERRKHLVEGIRAAREAAAGGAPAELWPDVRTECKAKEFLKSAGFTVPRGGLARNPQEAESIASSLGVPVALKVQSQQLAHKAKAGGVALNVYPSDAASTFSRLVARAAGAAPNARIDGVLVEEMVQADVEVMVGAVYDEQFGPVVAVGLGGVYTEEMAEYSTRLAPLSASEVAEMVQESKLGRILRDPGDPAFRALVELVVRLSLLAVGWKGWVREIDLNPVLLRIGRGEAVIADALFTLVSSLQRIDSD